MNFKAIMNNRWLDLLKRSLSGWMDDKALRLSAALAYYSIFSIAPLLVITIGIAGLVLGEKAVSDQLYGELKGYMGARSAEAIQSMVQSASKPSQGVMATVLGFVMLIVGASGVFGELKDALNTIWGVKAMPGGGIMAFVRGKFLNFGMVLVIGFLLLVSLVMSTAIAGLNQRLETVLPLPAFVWAAAAFVISLGMVTTLFALIFKVLPDAQIRWRHVWFGALITALLFEIGKTGLSWYLGRESTTSAFGAAGSVVLLLLWVYYTSCILFFGAEFTQVYAGADDCVTEPAANARRVTAEERPVQGLTSPVSPGETAPPPAAHAMDDAVHRLRMQPSPTRVVHHGVERNPGLTLLIAVAAGIVPVLLISGGKGSHHRAPRPVTINISKPPSKPLVGALLLGTLGVLAKAVTPALVKSAIVFPLLSFLARKQLARFIAGRGNEFCNASIGNT